MFYGTLEKQRGRAAVAVFRVDRANQVIRGLVVKHNKNGGVQVAFLIYGVPDLAGIPLPRRRVQSVEQVGTVGDAAALLA